ncbi:MAG: (5-formylfuran-3-yl)methyl phosphate synthase, partial [Pirellulales bacterium]
RAGAPSPAEVIAAADGLGCSVLLLDTFDKAAGGLFDCCPPGMPAAWVTAARAARLQVAVAGRIARAEIPAAWALRPDVVALRSAVCFNGRDGEVQARLVRRAVSLSRVSMTKTGS